MFKLAFTASSIAFAAMYGFAGLTHVDRGEQGVLIQQFDLFGGTKGLQAGGLTTGTTWVDPLYYDVKIYDTKRTQYPIEDIAAGTKDGQPISIDVSFDVGLKPDQVYNLAQELNDEWYTNIFEPAARSAIRKATSSVSSDATYADTGREQIADTIQSILTERLGKYFNISVNVRDIDFINPEYVAVLNKKAIAQQQEATNKNLAAGAKEEANRVANEAEGRKRAAIAEAEGNMEKARLIGEGQKLQKEQEAAGNLAILLAEAEGNLALAKSEAEGMRLRREALSGPGGKEMVEMAWATNLGPNVKVYGFPTGAPGTTSIVDINSVIKGALTKAE